MPKRLTPEQRAARVAVRAAARKIIKKLDEDGYHHRGRTEFTAHFHLDCDKVEVKDFQGHSSPWRSGYPIYQHASARVAR